MTLLAILVVIEVIWVLGWTIVTREDMLLERVGAWVSSRKSKIWKPILSCFWCMPSIHTVFAYGFAYCLGFIQKWDSKLLVLYPLVVMASSFIVGFLVNLLLKIEHQVIYFRNAEQYYHLQTKSMIQSYRKQKQKTKINKNG